MINSFRNYALLLVVFIHAHINLVDYSKVIVPPALSKVYYLFFSYFHPASLLAAISGYLFYRSFTGNEAKWNNFLKEKYSRRIRSIVVPYMFWVGFFFVFNNLAIYLIGRQKPGVFESGYHEISLLNYFKALLYPELAVAKHLWYLDNLLFVFILAPVVAYVCRRKSLFFAVFAGIFLFYLLVLSKNITNANMVIKYRFITFFLLGAFLALNRQYLSYFLAHKRLAAGISLVLFALAELLDYYYHNQALRYVINSLAVPVFIFYVAFALLQKYIPDRETVYNRSNHFLLYIIHPLLLSILCKVFFLSGVFNVTSYLLLLPMVFIFSWLVVMINNGIYFILNRYFKSFVHHLL